MVFGQEPYGLKRIVLEALEKLFPNPLNTHGPFEFIKKLAAVVFTIEAGDDVVRDPKPFGDLEPDGSEQPERVFTETGISIADAAEHLVSKILPPAVRVEVGTRTFIESHGVDGEVPSGEIVVDGSRNHLIGTPTVAIEAVLPTHDEVRRLPSGKVRLDGEELGLLKVDLTPISHPRPHLLVAPRLNGKVNVLRHHSEELVPDGTANLINFDRHFFTRRLTRG